jgi:hypothetical protein
MEKGKEMGCNHRESENCIIHRKEVPVVLELGSGHFQHRCPTRTPADLSTVNL